MRIRRAAGPKKTAALQIRVTCHTLSRELPCGPVAGAHGRAYLALRFPDKAHM